jgi:hypothetical protein
LEDKDREGLGSEPAGKKVSETLISTSELDVMECICKIPATQEASIEGL